VRITYVVSAETRVTQVLRGRLSIARIVEKSHHVESHPAVPFAESYLPIVIARLAVQAIVT
jgi:hypothetical protein